MCAVARPGQQRALIAMCGLVGMRVSEALSSRPSWFDFQEKIVCIRGKGDKFRNVPVSDEAWRFMFDSVAEAWMRGDDSLVISFKDRNARALITSIAKRARLRRHIASHDLRATFATEVYNKTKDAQVVQRLLGHAHGDTTAIYIEVAMDKMREAVQL
jgi:site-specific recombinase XerD